MNDTYLEKTISWIRMRGYSKIKSIHKEYEDPSGLNQQNGDLEIVPTATAYKHGHKSFFLVVQKTEDERAIKSKWKLLSIMARIKGGQLFLLVPRGTKAFADRIMQSSKIRAHVISI